MMGRMTQNIGWKLLSLLVAVLLWLAVVGESEVVTSVSVPIEFKNIPQELEIASEVPDRVHLEVRGPSGRLTPASLGEAAVVLDLGPVLRPGERTFTINQWNVNLPPGVILSRAIPAQLRVSFERRTTRSVPLQVRFGSPPPKDYRLVRYQVFPERLTIMGPENRVNQVEVVQTDAVDLANVIGESEFRVQAYVSDSQVRFPSSPSVTVKVLVERIPGAPQD